LVYKYIFFTSKSNSIYGALKCVGEFVILGNNYIIAVMVVLQIMCFPYAIPCESENN